MKKPIFDKDIKRLHGHRTFHLNGNGTVLSCHVQRKTVSASSLVVKAPNGFQVDHKNGDIYDNRRSNLRFATLSQNQFNRPKIRGISRYKGVTFDKRSGKWCAKIGYNLKSEWIGTFRNEVIAAKSYDSFARIYHAEFGRYNFPRKGEQKA